MSALPCVVAYLSFCNLDLGNLSIVSHLTRWTVPPTLRETAPLATLRSPAAIKLKLLSLIFGHINRQSFVLLIPTQ